MRQSSDLFKSHSDSFRNGRHLQYAVLLGPCEAMAISKYWSLRAGNKNLASRHLSEEEKPITCPHQIISNWFLNVGPRIDFQWKFICIDYFRQIPAICLVSKAKAKTYWNQNFFPYTTHPATKQYNYFSIIPAATFWGSEKIWC